jgi:hypothetical protein
MIFERKVGLQIVEGQIERRDASSQCTVKPLSHGWIDPDK